MGCSQNCGPPLFMCYIPAPNIQGYQNETLILGITHMVDTKQNLPEPKHLIFSELW